MKKIIMAFTGVGKSELVKQNPNSKIIDLDTTHFKKNEGWEAFYVDVAMAYQQLNYLVLICWYGESVVDELEKRNAQYVLVYPAIELKDEFIARYKSRNSQEDFVTNLNNSWDSHIRGIKRSKSKEKYELKSNEFLTDFVKFKNLL